MVWWMQVVLDRRRSTDSAAIPKPEAPSRSCTGAGKKNFSFPGETVCHLHGVPLQRRGSAAKSSAVVLGWDFCMSQTIYEGKVCGLVENDDAENPGLPAAQYRWKSEKDVGGSDNGLVSAIRLKIQGAASLQYSRPHRRSFPCNAAGTGRLNGWLPPIFGGTSPVAPGFSFSERTRKSTV